MKHRSLKHEALDRSKSTSPDPEPWLVHSVFLICRLQKSLCSRPNFWSSNERHGSFTWYIWFAFRKKSRLQQARTPYSKVWLQTFHQNAPAIEAPDSAMTNIKVELWGAIQQRSRSSAFRWLRTTPVRRNGKNLLRIHHMGTEAQKTREKLLTENYEKWGNKRKHLSKTNKLYMYIANQVLQN